MSTHLTEAQLQGLADGTLRGPEGMAAREHCDACAECGAELSIYAGLMHGLSALQDPPPPADFTGQVIAAIEVREDSHHQRRHTLLAAVPAAALALFAIVGWALSTAPAAHVDALIDGVTVLRHAMGALGPVFNAARLPLGVGAFVLFAAVLTALSRTLRPARARLTAHG